MFLGDRRLSMLSLSEMVDVLDFDFDMEDGEKVANHFHSTSFFLLVINIFIAVKSKIKYSERIWFNYFESTISDSFCYSFVFLPKDLVDNNFDDCIFFYAVVFIL